MELFRVIVLLAATVTMGLMAGVFLIFSNAIMPGLGRTDHRTFVGAFQAIDRAIMNPLFLTCFLGGLGFTGGAALLHLPAEERAALPWLLVAFLLYLAVVVVTLRVNVPLNNELRAAGDPDQIPDLAAARARFEAPWVRWNHLRTVLSLVAFVALTWSLVESARL